MHARDSHRIPARAGWLAAGGLLAALLLASCSLPQAQPDLTRYYLLTPVAGSAPAAFAASDAPAPRVFIRTVQVPEFLRGRNVVVSASANELRYVDEARWAEPLDLGLQRVLRENLAQRAGVAAVLRSTDEHEFDILLQLRHCEGNLLGRGARFAARLEVLSAGVEPKSVAQEDFTLDLTGWDGRDYGQLAAKLSEGVAGLSDRLASLLPRKNP